MPRKPRPPEPVPEPTPAPAPAPTGKRFWPAPVMSSPLTFDVGGPDYGVNRILDGRGMDVWLRFVAPVTRRPIVRNARHVRTVGGEVRIDTEWTYQYTGQDVSHDDRWAFYNQGCTGVVDLEGLHMHGAAIIEGVDCGQWSAAPNQYPVAVQIQSCRIEGLRDPEGAHHADTMQMWGGAGALRVYNCTLESQFQCLMAKANENRLGLVDMRRVNMRGLDVQQAYMLNHQHGPNADGNLMCERIAYGGDGSVDQRVLLRRPVASKPGADFGHANFGKVATPNAATNPNACVLGTEGGRQFLHWPTAAGPTVTGRVWEHLPGEADYVPASAVGMGYVP